MKKTLKHFLTESKKLSHWPKNKEELIAAYEKVMVDQETGEVMMPPYYDELKPETEHLAHLNVTEFNDDLTVSIKHTRASRVQIHKWMLVNGQLPFPFKDVDIEFSIEKGCDLKSLAGVPRKCESFKIWMNSLAESVSNLVGGPEDVEEDYIVQLCLGIKSTEGLPKSVGGRLELSCPNLEDFSRLPKEVKSLMIGHTLHFTEEHLQYLPAHSEEIDLSMLGNLHSFHNIHKYVKSVKKIGTYEIKIRSSILGLSMISGLEEIDECFFDVNSDDEDWPTEGIQEIVNKYIGTHDVFEFQEELVNAGLKELAKQ